MGLTVVLLLLAVLGACAGALASDGASGRGDAQRSASSTDNSKLTFSPLEAFMGFGQSPEERAVVRQLDGTSLRLLRQLHRARAAPVT